MKAVVVVALMLATGCGVARPADVVVPAHVVGSAGPSGHVVPATEPSPSGAALPRVVEPRTAPRAAASARGDLLVIDSLGVRARIRPVRFAGSRLQIPPSVAEVGLWSDGAGLRDAIGTTVLVGHVSDNSDRPGVLARLRSVRVGAVLLIRVGTRTYRFRTTRVRSYSKTSLPRSVFAQAGPHRLVLITCSHKVVYPTGRFHYAQNLVVTARPL